jgi:hypothetical protein
MSVSCPLPPHPSLNPLSSSGSGPGPAQAEHLGNTAIRGELESSRMFLTVLEGSRGFQGDFKGGRPLEGRQERQEGKEGKKGKK